MDRIVIGTAHADAVLDLPREAAPNIWNKPSAPRQHAVVMIIGPAKTNPASRAKSP
jgi:hypothetical protein